MISVRLLTAVALCVTASTGAVEAQDLSHYRDFELGSSVSSVTTTSGARSADLKVVHQRPAIIQELVWRPQYVLRSSRAAADPVREIAFTFYNDRLFQIVVMYERERTEGLTNTDLIDALSAIYGAPVIPSARRAGPAPLGPADLYDGTAVAQWEDTRHRLTLSRGTYPVVFRLVVLSRELGDLATAAAIEAGRLDDREAPQREADRLNTEIADARTAQEKARLVNKAAFRP
jgi:hypothetical protein